jgi:hypothetical protein
LPSIGSESVVARSASCRAGKQHHHSAAAEMCPELNSVENVWQFLRDNWLSNRIFKSYDDLVDHCCVAWNKLVDQPWRIMSLGLDLAQLSVECKTQVCAR